MRYLNHAIAVGVALVVSGMTIAAIHVSSKMTPNAQFYYQAKKWCDSEDGEFWDGIVKNISAKLPECKLPLYKGKARIFDGYEVLEFGYTIKDYDTGESELYVNKRGRFGYHNQITVKYITRGEK